MIARQGGIFASLVLAFSLWLPGGEVAAATIDCETALATDVACQGSRVVVGDDLSIFTFTIEDGGWHVVNLFDYEWPNQPLSSLSLLLSTSRSVVGSLDMEGSLLFFADPQDYFLQVYAAANDAVTAGLYGVNVQATVVPLPAGIILLVSALAVCGVAARKTGGGVRPERALA